MWNLFYLSIMFVTPNLSAQEDSDLIIYHGKIATMERPGEFKQAIASKDGIILGVGSSSEITTQ
jgi:predicted amidohydrolase YtcJ